MWSEEQKGTIGRYGITIEAIQKAYSHLVTLPTSLLDRFTTPDAQQVVFEDIVTKCALSKAGLTAKLSMRESRRGDGCQGDFV